MTALTIILTCILCAMIARITVRYTIRSEMSKTPRRKRAREFWNKHKEKQKKQWRLE